MRAGVQAIQLQPARPPRSSCTAGSTAVGRAGRSPCPRCEGPPVSARPPFHSVGFPSNCLDTGLPVRTWDLRCALKGPSRQIRPSGVYRCRPQCARSIIAGFFCVPPRAAACPPFMLSASSQHPASFMAVLFWCLPQHAAARRILHGRPQCTLIVSCRRSVGPLRRPPPRPAGWTAPRT